MLTEIKNNINCTAAVLLGLALFLCTVTAIAVRHFGTLFWDAHGWRHRLAGGLHLVWLVVGAFFITTTPATATTTLMYDVVLGGLGITATVTAALDFPHRYVSNAPGQSGTLSERAMVTQHEMLEHAFYQCLNLCQALYLHAAAATTTGSASSFAFWDTRWMALLLVTAPWLVRDVFPVHSFSQNWKQLQLNNESTTTTISALYKIKKIQYLFYKHVVLHGVNLTIFLAESSCSTNPQQAATLPALVHTTAWRVFWICLNASYVMEFFLQSLVKRHVLAQPTMLALNRWLMLVSSLAAAQALLWSNTTSIRWDLCLASCALNLLHRKHDVLNTMLIGTVAMVATTVPGNKVWMEWFP